MQDHEMNSLSHGSQDLDLFALRAPIKKPSTVKREDVVFSSNIYSPTGKPFEFLLDDSENLPRGIRYIPTYNSTWQRYKSGIFKLFQTQHEARTEQDCENGLFEADWAHKANSAFDDLWNHAYFNGKPVGSLPNNFAAIIACLTDQNTPQACLKIMLGLTGWVLCENKRGEQRLFHPLLVRLAVNAVYLTDYSDKALDQKRTSLKASKKDLFAMNVPMPVKSYDQGHFIRKTGYGLLDDPIFVYRKRALVVVGNDFVPQRKDSPLFKDILHNPAACFEFVKSGVDVNIALSLITNEVTGEKNPNTKQSEKYDRNKAYEYAIEQLKAINPYQIHSVVDPDTMADQSNSDLRHQTSIERFTGKCEEQTVGFTGKPTEEEPTFTAKHELDPAVFTGLNRSKEKLKLSEVKVNEEKNIIFKGQQASGIGKDSEAGGFSDFNDGTLASQERDKAYTANSEVVSMRDIHPQAQNGACYEFRSGADALEFNQRVFFPEQVMSNASAWMDVSQFVSTIVFNGFAAKGGESLLNLRKQWDKNELTRIGGVHVLALKRSLYAARKKREESLKISDPSGMGCLCAYIVSVAAAQSAIIKNIEDTFSGLSKSSANKLFHASNTGVAHATDVRDLGGIEHLEQVLADCQEPGKLGLTLKKEADRLRALGNANREDAVDMELLATASRFHDEFL